MIYALILNIMLLGDFNADCSYASGTARANFALRLDERFDWLIDDDVDTTVSSTDCAYDRYFKYIVHNWLTPKITKKYVFEN